MTMSWMAIGAFAIVAVTTTGLAQPSTGPDDLTWGADPHPDFSVLPRLTGQGAEQINPSLKALDTWSEANREECIRDEDTNDPNWTRTVWAPFTGPRFLTVATNDSYYCGGAHPSVDIRHMTFDRESGSLLDWSVVWPAAEIDPAREGFGSWPAVARSRAVRDWYRDAVRTDADNDPSWLDQCGLHDLEPYDEPIVVWLDAEHGGIGMDWAFLPHAMKACGSPQIMPIEEAVRLGLSPEVARAVRHGHAARAYRGL